MAENGRSHDSRLAWEQALAWALRARATELAAASPALADAVSTALLEGLERAMAGGDWSTVAQLGAALRDRQGALQAVTSIDAARRRRGRDR